MGVGVVMCGKEPITIGTCEYFPSIKKPKINDPASILGVEQSPENAYIWAMVSADGKSKSQRRYKVNAVTYKKSLTSDQESSAAKAIQSCLDSRYEDCPY